MARSMLGYSIDNVELRKNEFWALQDINFELKRGETLGLIGQNGCGKTTLLRLINGIFPPDKGRIEINGRIGALIAVGAGFHPHMTGRENIYLNGIILGMTKKEIDKKFDEIIDFAEIGDFIDSPVCTYSSGMNVRLGFAIAIHTNPELLLIDEILAVGDMGFTIKCLNKIDKIISNSAVVFVSHNMQFISRICSEVIVLGKGEVLLNTKDVSKGIDFYNSLFDVSGAKEVTGSNKAKLLRISLDASHISRNKDLVAIDYGAELIVSIDLHIDKDIKESGIFLYIQDNQLKPVMEIVSGDQKGYFVKNDGNIITVKIFISKLNLNFGIYSILIAVSDYNTREVLTRVANAYRFYVKKTIYNSWACSIVDAKWSSSAKNL